MSETKATFSLESETPLLSSGNQEPPQTEVVVGPTCVTVGERFKKPGRRVINWQDNPVAHPPHGSLIVIFAEIDVSSVTFAMPRPVRSRSMASSCTAPTDICSTLFIHDGANHRTNAYGGTIENPARLLLEGATICAKKILAPIASASPGLRGK